MILLILLVVYDIYARHSPKLPDDSQDNAPEHNYGWRRGDKGAPAPGQCFVQANGTLFVPWKDRYHLAFACFVWDGQGDPKDDSTIIFSKSYDVFDSDQDMILYWDSSFATHVPEGKYTSLNIVLFVVPKEVDIERAKNLRQAKAMGAIQVWHGAAGGS
jgi:hypothetical protein